MCVGVVMVDDSDIATKLSCSGSDNWNPSWNHHRHHNWHGGGWSHSYCYWNGNQYNIGDRGEYCGSCEYNYCYCVEDESGGSPNWGQCYN